MTTLNPNQNRQFGEVFAQGVRDHLSFVHDKIRY